MCPLWKITCKVIAYLVNNRLEAGNEAAKHGAGARPPANRLARLAAHLLELLASRCVIIHSRVRVHRCAEQEQAGEGADTATDDERLHGLDGALFAPYLRLWRDVMCATRKW